MLAAMLPMTKRNVRPAHVSTAISATNCGRQPYPPISIEIKSESIRSTTCQGCALSPCKPGDLCHQLWASAISSDWHRDRNAEVSVQPCVDILVLPRLLYSSVLGREFQDMLLVGDPEVILECFEA
jgi:hypothetical protein